MPVELVDAYRVSDHRRARMPRTLLDVIGGWAEGEPPAGEPAPAVEALAAAGEMDVEDAANVAATAVSQFGLAAPKTPRRERGKQLADGQATTQKRTTSVDQPQSEED